MINEGSVWADPRIGVVISVRPQLDNADREESLRRGHATGLLMGQQAWESKKPRITKSAVAKAKERAWGDGQAAQRQTNKYCGY